MEQPPSSITKELSEYLSRMFSKTENRDQLIKHGSMPDKLSVGKLYYFTRAISTDITQEGLYLYKSTGWSYLG